MLFRCDKCGTICRVDETLKTDWNTQIEIKNKKAKCPACKSWSTYKTMTCYDWVEELVFKVKGK